MSVHNLDRELRAVQELKKSFASAFEDDPGLVADMIEGETGLLEAITKIMESVEEDQILLDGITTRLADLGERKSRIAKRVETKRTLALQALVIAERKTIEAPTFTLTKRREAPRLVVTEEAEIPSMYWAPQPPKLDKTAVKKALKEGVVIPGAMLDNGGVSLQIRRK